MNQAHRENQGTTRPQRQAYTRHEVAAILGCHPNTISNQIAAKQIPVIRLGRLVRIPRSYVESRLAGAIAGEP